MDFSVITEALKKAEYLEGYKNRDLFSSELSPTASNEECVNSPKSDSTISSETKSSVTTDRSDTTIERTLQQDNVERIRSREIYNEKNNLENQNPYKRLQYEHYRKTEYSTLNPPPHLSRFPPRAELYPPADIAYSHKNLFYTSLPSLLPPPKYFQRDKYYNSRPHHTYLNINKPLKRQECLYSYSTQHFNRVDTYLNQSSPTYTKTSQDFSHVGEIPRLSPDPPAHHPQTKREGYPSSYLQSSTGNSHHFTLNKGCAVCDDRLSSFYHGAVICASCRGFFKRALKNNRKYTCELNRNCNLNKKTRNHCQACRLASCFKVGIKKEAVLEEIHEEKERKAGERLARKRNIDTSPLPIIDLKLISDAEMFAYPHIDDFADVRFKPIQHLYKATDKQLVSLSEWARRLPYFNDVQIIDQANLLRASWTELLIGAFCFRSTSIMDGILLENGLHISRETLMNEEEEVIVKQIFNELIPTMNELQIDLTEWGCMRAMIMFSPDVPDVSNQQQIENIRELYISTLQDYCAMNYPNDVKRFIKLLLFLPKLKSISLQIVDRLKNAVLMDGISVDAFVYDVLKNTQA